MRRFVKTSGHADAYEALKITFVSGKVPTLHIKEDGNTIEKIDLSSYSTDGIHTLLTTKGFERKVVGSSSS